MNIGEQLKKTRQNKDISLEEIQEKTKIRTKYLQALEDNNFNIIPGRVYARAFLKEYARQLNLDVEQIIMEFENIYNSGEKEEDETESRGNRFWKNKKNVYLTVFTLVIIIIFTVYYFFM